MGRIYLDSPHISICVKRIFVRRGGFFRLARQSSGESGSAGGFKSFSHFHST